ncbi:DDB1- and CUL4-associated factor 5-like [Rhopilema esculentum]|uniref:DDB1- and CUL4-associated factor 5-like n=1 Tax=Rhopilema esculentum TaxID=499914 RepID=UPI0031DE4B2E
MDYAYSKNLHLKARQFCRERFLKCGSLYRKDLFGHYGCVNAVEFSHDGQWLVSGGDDRRVLLWNINKATRQKIANNCQLKTEHLSNIFCTVFDNETRFVFSAGNDEDVIRHDVNRDEAVGHYGHEEAVYCVALPSDCSDIFATAGECGVVFLWDVRAPEEERICVAMSSGSFHGVAFNPYETKLVVTANAHDGVSLYDLRKPDKPLMLYGDSGQRESAMFAKFDQFGTRILALMRRAGPVLFDIGKKRRLIEFNHPEYKNICTLKSPCFVGDADQFIAAGSDDFNLYIWENPRGDVIEDCIDEPAMVLKGHRSIVNQIRYNHHAQAIVSSGVEKVIKLWSQFKMEGCTGYLKGKDSERRREFYSHEEYMQLIVESGEPLSHDYGMRSVDEDPRMIAFFDSLIQRVNAGWFSDDSSDDESPMDVVLLQLASELNDENDETSTTPSILDLIRTMMRNQSQAESAVPSFLNRRLRQLLASQMASLTEEIDSDSSSGSEPAIEGQIQPDSEENIRSLFQGNAALQPESGRPSCDRSPRARRNIDNSESNVRAEGPGAGNSSHPIREISERNTDTLTTICHCKNRRRLDEKQKNVGHSGDGSFASAVSNTSHPSSSMAQNSFTTLNYKGDREICNNSGLNGLDSYEDVNYSDRNNVCVNRYERRTDHCKYCDHCREIANTRDDSKDIALYSKIEPREQSKTRFFGSEESNNNNRLSDSPTSNNLTSISVRNDKYSSQQLPSSSTCKSENASQSCTKSTATDEVKRDDVKLDDVILDDEILDGANHSSQSRAKRPLSSEVLLGSFSADVTAGHIEGSNEISGNVRDSSSHEENECFRRRDHCQKRKYRKHDD